MNGMLCQDISNPRFQPMAANAFSMGAVQHDQLKLIEENYHPKKAKEAELNELMVYSTIWFGGSTALLNHFVFQVTSNNIAFVVGAAIPWVMGKEWNLKAHWWISSYLTFDPAQYSSKYNSAAIAPQPLHKGGY